MDAFNIFTYLLCALAVMPVLLVFRIIALEARKRRQVSIIEDDMAWTVQDCGSEHEVDVVGGDYDIKRTHEHLRATARCEVNRPFTARVANVDGGSLLHTLNPDAFEYTIRRHYGTVRQDVIDMGGFSQVPLMLYDRAGNYFTVHRRLSLN